MKNKKLGKRRQVKKTLLNRLNKELEDLNRRQDIIIERETSITDEGFTSPDMANDLRLEIKEYPKFCKKYGISCLFVTAEMRKMLRALKRQDRFVAKVLKGVARQLGLVNAQIAKKTEQVNKLKAELEAANTKPKVAVPTYEL